jgi:hypothetical protein
MKHVALLAALVSVLVTGACSSKGGSPLDSINAPAPPDTGPGCYDHKNRIERTVMTKAECEILTWTWKP